MRLLATVAVVLPVAATAVALSGGACTVFDDAEVPPEQDAGTTAWVPFDPSYLSLQQGARLCRWVLSCDGLAESVGASIAVHLHPTNYSACLHWAAGPLPPARPGFAIQSQLLADLAEASGCDDAMAKAFVRVFDATTEPQCPGAESTACDGADALDCDEGRAYRCDSPRFLPGHSCEQGSATGASLCSFEACTDADEAASCATDTVFFCRDELRIAAPCGVQGMVCANDESCGASPGNVLACTDPPGTASCAAGAARVCGGRFVPGTVSEMLAAEFRCDALDGGSCTDDGAPRCRLASDVCSPVDADQNACDGSRLRACVGGQRIVFDCASIGLGCLPASDDLSGRCG